MPGSRRLREFEKTDFYLQAAMARAFSRLGAGTRIPPWTFKRTQRRSGYPLPAQAPAFRPFQIDALLQKYGEIRRAVITVAQEYRKTVAQCLCRHHFRRRHIGPDGAQPGTEMLPYRRRIAHRQVLQHALGDAADLDEAVIRSELAADGITVGGCFMMRVTVADAALLWMQGPHPEVSKREFLRT